MLIRCQMDSVHWIRDNEFRRVKKAHTETRRHSGIAPAHLSRLYRAASEHAGREADLRNGGRGYYKDLGREPAGSSHACQSSLDEDADRCGDVFWRNRKPRLEIVGPEHHDQEINRA